jgi:hypothetical protein
MRNVCQIYEFGFVLEIKAGIQGSEQLGKGIVFVMVAY